MSTKKRQPNSYVVDTSAVRAAMGESTRRHERHFAEETGDGSLYGSTYIRMEMIRLWVCEFIRIALTIRQFGNVDEALVYLEQSFKPRQVKADVAGMAHYLRACGAVSNSALAAEEMARLAWHWIERFDKVFPSRVKNASKCQIGGMSPDVDFDSLLPDLQRFYEQFREPITDCEINAFLQLSKSTGRAAKLLRIEGVDKLTVGKHLSKFKATQKWITCMECEKIGDAVIALEVPRRFTLVSTDKSFNTLQAIGFVHKKIDAVLTIEPDPTRGAEDSSDR